MSKLYDEFYWKRKELMRLRSIYKKREARAKQAGLYDATYLSQITQGQLGYMLPTKKTKPGDDMDLFSLDSFLRRDERAQEQHIQQLDRKIQNLQEMLDNPLTSLRGLRNYLKYELKTNKIDMQSPKVLEKLKRYRENPEGTYKGAKVKAIMDAIDANPTLTEDEKKKLKALIHERLNRREKVDYSDWILEWDVDIKEILEDPKGVMDRLAEELPDDVVKRIIGEAQRAETTDNPRQLGF